MEIQVIFMKVKSRSILVDMKGFISIANLSTF